MADKEKKFWISKDNWRKIISYAESSYSQFKAEIGGQLVVLEDKEGDFILEDPVILKQTVSSGNCEMDEQALALHYSKMAKKHGDSVRHCWWHSHHTMGAFWSGTDDSTILENKSNDFTVSLVVNLKQEYKLRVQFFYPFEHEENVKLNFMIDDVERDEALDKEVKELCEKDTVTVTSQRNGWGHHIGYNRYNNGSQLALNEQNDDMDVWNQSFIADKNHLSLNHELDTSKCTNEQVQEVVSRIEALSDMYTSKVNCDYKKFMSIRKVINKDIRKWNMRIKMMHEHELDNEIMMGYPDDLLENIKGGTSYGI